MPITATVSREQLPTLEVERTISEVTTSPEDGWIEIVYQGDKRVRLTLESINEAREAEVAPLVPSDLERPRLRLGKKVMLGRRVVDAWWLICLAECSE